MFCFKHLVFEPLIYSYMETEGVKNISVLKIFDYLMLHDPPNWPSVHCRALGEGRNGKKGRTCLTYPEPWSVGGSSLQRESGLLYQL